MYFMVIRWINLTRFLLEATTEYMKVAFHRVPCGWIYPLAKAHNWTFFPEFWRDTQWHGPCCQVHFANIISMFRSQSHISSSFIPFITAWCWSWRCRVGNLWENGANERATGTASDQRGADFNVSNVPRKNVSIQVAIEDVRHELVSMSLCYV